MSILNSLVDAERSASLTPKPGGVKTLIDALVTQKLLAEKAAAARTITLESNSPAGSVADQNETALTQMSQNEVMQGVSGVLGQQQKQEQQNLQQAKANPPTNAGQPQQMFAEGGIVGYKKGKKIDPKNLSKTALERFLRAPLDSKFGRFLYNPPEEKEFNDVSDPIERANKFKDEAVYQTRRTDPSAGLDSIMQQSISGGGTLEDKARRLGVTVEQLRQAGLKSANLNKLIDPSVGGVSADNPRKMPGQINTDGLEMRPSFNKNLQSTDQITSPKPAVEPFEPNMRDRNMRVPGMEPKGLAGLKQDGDAAGSGGDRNERLRAALRGYAFNRPDELQKLDLANKKLDTEAETASNLAAIRKMTASSAGLAKARTALTNAAKLYQQLIQEAPSYGKLATLRQEIDEAQSETGFLGFGGPNESEIAALKQKLRLMEKTVRDETGVQGAKMYRLMQQLEQEIGSGSESGVTIDQALKLYGG